MKTDKIVYPARSGGLIALLVFFIGSVVFGMVKLQDEPDPITLAEFNAIVANKDTAVLVYCSASWCGACKKMAPVIEEIESYKLGKLKVLHVDADRDKELNEEFELNTLPMMMLYKKGEQKWVWTGIMDKAKLKAKLDPHLY